MKMGMKLMQQQLVRLQVIGIVQLNYIIIYTEAKWITVLLTLKNTDMIGMDAHIQAFMMTEIVKDGSSDEIEYYENNPDEGISPLLEGGKDWVHSITSVATPHIGSTFADEDELIPFIKEMVIHVASAAGINQARLVYEF